MGKIPILWQICLAYGKNSHLMADMPSLWQICPALHLVLILLHPASHHQLKKSSRECFRMFSEKSYKPVYALSFTNPLRSSHKQNSHFLLLGLKQGSRFVFEEFQDCIDIKKKTTCPNTTVMCSAGWQVLAGFRNRIPQPFRRARICKFLQQKT